MSEKIGTDLIKKFIKFLYDTSIEGIEAFKDKKLSLQEILGFGDNIYTGITLSLKFSEFCEQIKDVDSEEAAEIAAYIGELIKDATPDEIDIVINNAIEIITKEIDVYENNIKPIIEVIRK